MNEAFIFPDPQQANITFMPHNPMWSVVQTHAPLTRPFYPAVVVSI